MHVSCKTLTSSKFVVECDASETVASLKAKIEAANPALPAATAVTVYQGKVLADATTLADAGITEAGFVVVMTKKAAVPSGEPPPPPGRVLLCVPSLRAASCAAPRG